MDNEKSDFLSAGDPMIIVKKLTKEVLEKAIQAYAEDDAYYLKFYAANLDVKTLDVLKDRSIARSKFIDHLYEKGESMDIENCDLIDFNINNDSNNNFGQQRDIVCFFRKIPISLFPKNKKHFDKANKDFILIPVESKRLKILALYGKKLTKIPLAHVKIIIFTKIFKKGLCII